MLRANNGNNSKKDWDSGTHKVVVKGSGESRSKASYRRGGVLQERITLGDYMGERRKLDRVAIERGGGSFTEGTHAKELSYEGQTNCRESHSFHHQCLLQKK